MQVAILISATFNAAGDEDSCRSSRAPIRRAAYRGVGVADGVRAGKDRGRAGPHRVDSFAAAADRFWVGWCQSGIEKSSVHRSPWSQGADA